ncbi:hypothetical protein PSAB6_50148 [Paraburkholderia sabiae]|nr:hypothetical protein PSAB6_50148 [Paraburkholderia sabiae]
MPRVKARVESGSGATESGWTANGAAMLPPLHAKKDFAW